MIQYFLSFSVEKNLTHLKLLFKPQELDKTNLILPLWRPGRYEIQNFAKNILNFKAKTKDKKALKWQKTAKNIWQIEYKDLQTIIIEYDFYAADMNAGGSVVNQKLKYINPINAFFYQENSIDDNIELNIASENHELIASGLRFTKHDNYYQTNVKNFYQLVDSPFILSQHLQQWVWNTEGVAFNFWIHGNFEIEKTKLIADLHKIAAKQISIFGEFPEPYYHFMLIVPENNAYHGVEHAHSTMLVLSANGTLTNEDYFDLIGLASHELFHAWNICKIRPKELLPYDFNKENYFETCFVAEGFTTYLGNKIAYEAGVFDENQYLKELEFMYKQHFENDDLASQSLLESSFDLWVDGYNKGTSNKKVSMYNKGAIAAQVLDLLLQSKKVSLENVLRQLWLKFGKTNNGYTYEDIKQTCQEVFGDSLHEYFEFIIESNQPILDYTNQFLQAQNLKILLQNKQAVLTKF